MEPLARKVLHVMVMATAVPTSGRVAELAVMLVRGLVLMAPTSGTGRTVATAFTLRAVTELSMADQGHITAQGTV
jgi:hypothetical protein